jgi:hypothetical protein
MPPAGKLDKYQCEKLLMPSFATWILIAASAGVIWLVWALHQQVRRGGIIVIPMASFTWLAIVAIVTIVLFGLSPLHLLWLLPLSVFFALWVIMIPGGLKLTINFLALIAGPLPTPPAKNTSRQTRKSRRSQSQRGAKKR